MNHHCSLFRITLILFLLIIPTAVVHAGVGGPYGEYSMAYSGPETLTLFVRPDGGGSSFEEAFLPYGTVEDATITLLLRDANYDPIPNYPREDMWLESDDGGLAICLGGTIADSDTDQNGETLWRNPLRGGGHSQEPTVVKVNGVEPDLTNGVHLNFNSPDINGDLVVNLTDVALFAEDFFLFPVYNFRSDFHRDGQINLVDLMHMGQSFGASCP